MNIKKTYIYSLLRRIYKEVRQKNQIGFIDVIDEQRIKVDKEFQIVKKRVTEYFQAINKSNRVGYFSDSVENQSIYAYSYYVMLAGLLGIDISNEENIREYLLGSQLGDGFFYDKQQLSMEYILGDGWGKRHFVPHVLIAMERLGVKPEKPFVFLEPFYSADRMQHFLNDLKWEDAWATSNVLMNITVCLQYARDYLGDKRAVEPICVVQEWLLSHIQSKTGMWYKGEIKTIVEKLEAIRCAYHLYPLLDYDGIEIPYKERAIDIILSVQNKYGGFDTRKNSSACEDIDAVDALIRLARKTNGYREEEITSCLKRAFYWIKQNQMSDGGFVFRRGEAFNYGCENVRSCVNESNMFATWFRFLSLCYIHDYLTGYRRDYVDLPGYEYPLFER